MLTNKKQPLPYVVFAPPGLNKPWPIAAAYWSPIHASIFIP